MTNEQLEYAISQYLDGLLPPEQAIVLEQQLASDPAARRLLAEYRQLNTLLASSLPTPDVDWDKLAGNIHRAVAHAPGTSLPFLYRFPSLLTRRSMALAALLLLTVGSAFLVFHLLSSRPQEQTAQSFPAPYPKVAQLQVFQTEPITAAPVTEIQIGPSPLARNMKSYSTPSSSAALEPASVSIASSPVAKPSRDEDTGILQ